MVALFAIHHLSKESEPLSLHSKQRSSRSLDSLGHMSALSPMWDGLPRSCASWRVESASWDHLEPQWESGPVGEEDGVNACWEGYRKVPLCDLYLLYWWAAGRWTETVDSPGYCAFLGQRWGGDCPRRVCN